MRPWFLPVFVALLAGSTVAFGYGIYTDYSLNKKLLAQSSALGHRLTAYDQQLARAARAMGQQIGYYVYQNRYQRRDVAVQQHAERIIKRADSMADSLRAQVKAGRLTGLARHLARYGAFIRQYIPDAPPLPQPNGALPLGADFSAYYFRDLPPASIQANLARLRTQVRRLEVDAVSTQAQKVGSRCLCFDKIDAVAIPVSGTVAPGGIYEAHLLLAESFADFYYKQMSANGLPVRRFEGAQGLVEIPIPTTVAPQADTVRTAWQGVIRGSLYPGDTTWQIRVPYLVINKPTP